MHKCIKIFLALKNWNFFSKMHFFQSTAVVFKISGQLWEVFWVVSVNKVGIIIVCSFVSLLLLLKFEWYISKNSKSNCIKNTVVPNWITLIKSNSKKLDFFGVYAMRQLHIGTSKIPGIFALTTSKSGEFLHCFAFSCYVFNL